MLLNICKLYWSRNRIMYCIVYIYIYIYYFNPLNKYSRCASSTNSVRHTPRFSPGQGLTVRISYLGQLCV